MGRGDSFGQKKGNQEFRYTPPVPYKRQEAGTPIYSPYQTKRYKSEWNRYQAGEALSRKESDQVKDETGKTVEYRFYSQRSNVGYWSVKRSTDKQIDPGAWQNQLFVFGLGSEGTSSFGATSNTLALGIQGQTGAGGGFNVLTWQTFSSDTTPINIKANAFPGGTPAPPPAIGPITQQVQAFLFQGFWTPDAITFDRSSTYNAYPRWVTIEISPEGGVTVTEGSLSTVLNLTPLNDSQLWGNSNDPNFQTLFFRSSSGGQQFAPDLSASHNFNVNFEFELGPPGVGGFECNCPDYTKKEDAVIESLWPSLQANRAWTDSAAGAPGDCKHIIASKFLAEEPPDPPSFDSIDPEETDTSILKPWNPKRRQGDDFSADLTW